MRTRCWKWERKRESANHTSNPHRVILRRAFPARHSNPKRSQRQQFARSPIPVPWSCRRANPHYRPCQSELFAFCRLGLCAVFVGCSCACRGLWPACDSFQPSSSRMPYAQKAPASKAGGRASGDEPDGKPLRRRHASTELHGGLVKSAHNKGLFRQRRFRSKATLHTIVRNIHGVRGVHSVPCPNPPPARTAVAR